MEDVLGCIDEKASNFNAAATTQSHDQWNNSTCVYESCDDIPDEEGCSYADGYSPLVNTLHQKTVLRTEELLPAKDLVV